VSKKLKYLLATLGILLVLTLVAWSPWSGLLYCGDGKLSDNLFFYPRYKLKFADIPLNEVNEYHFHFTGAPHEEMGLVLYVKGGLTDWDYRHSLLNFPASIDAKLTDGKGNIVCHASGRPADANSDGVWVLMFGPGVAGYWHYQCNDFRVSTLGTYELTIHVTDVGPDAEKVVVAPTLEGGGIELP
jgi:hypothetical protein